MTRILLLLLMALVAGPGCRDGKSGEPAKAWDARIQAFDALARPGEEVVLRAKVEIIDSLRTYPDLHAARLVFRYGQARIGRARTGDDGLAETRWTVPATVRADLRVSVSLHETEVRRAAPSTMLVAVRDGSRPILVSDIDHTIADVPSLAFPFRSPEEIPTLPGAAAALGRLSERYDIVYLTARDDIFVEATRRWLALRGFPVGPVYHHDLKLTDLGGTRYKTRRLRELKGAGWSLEVGVGDRTGDAEAYLANGLRALLIGDQDLPDGAERIASWVEVEAALAGR